MNSFVRVILKILAFAVVALLSNAARAAPPISELILLFNQDAVDFPLTAEQIVAAVNERPPRLRDLAIDLRLGAPSGARFLIRNRAPTSLRQQLAATPFERLQRYVVLTYANPVLAEIAFLRLRSDPDVLSITKNGPVEFSVAPSDPYYAIGSNIMDYQWGLHTLNMSGAWDLVRGNAYIGHVDSGIMRAHPDLSFAYRPQFVYDAVPVDGTVEEYGQFRGHGTHIAGIIAANTSYSGAQGGFPSPAPLGVSGVCWYCSLLIARVWDGNPLTDAVMIDSIYWATNSGAQAINMSFGKEPGSAGFPDCATSTSAWCDALAWASSLDVVITAAAGNGAKATLNYPAADSRTIAVGAIQSYVGARGYLWTEEVPNSTYIFVGSSTGPGMDTRGVVAPGRDILSTSYTGYDWNPYVRCGDNGFGSSADPGVWDLHGDLNGYRIHHGRDRAYEISESPLVGSRHSFAIACGLEQCLVAKPVNWIRCS